MNNEETIRIKRTLKIIPLLFFCICTLFMYNGYKCLSGLIANNFDDFLRMFTMVLSYMYPVICFIVFFYNNYVKTLNKITSIIYSSLTVIVGIFNLINILINLQFYISNNNMGAYISLSSILNSFPYDAIAVNIFLILIQIYNFSLIIKPNHKYAYIKEYFVNQDVFSFKIYEYLLLSLLAILTFIFLGAGISGLSSIKNAYYDPKYIFLLLWVFLIPFMNLIFLSFKFNHRNITFKTKLILNSVAILVNIIFIVLVLLFELIYPSYMVYIAKPLFMIAFSISFPIEMLLLIGIGIISIIILAINFFKLIKNRQKEKEYGKN